MDKKIVVQPEEGLVESFKKNALVEEQIKEVVRPKRKAVVRHCLKLNCRRHASMGAEVVRLLKEGEKVEVLKEVNPDWSKIKVDDEVSYVMSRYLAEA